MHALISLLIPKQEALQSSVEFSAELIVRFVYTDNSSLSSVVLSIFIRAPVLLYSLATSVCIIFYLAAAEGLAGS